jgi:PKHD-type hydroxylase
MIITLHGMLGNEQIETIRSLMRNFVWEPGSKTAGEIAGQVKHNLQATDGSAHDARTLVARALMADGQFNALVRPQTIGLMFSKYETGAQYGTHIDGAVMAQCRRDVSFTIGINPPEAYDGGDLVIEDTPFTESHHRLPSGSMVVYPATHLHRVEPVTRGERLVIVGWARSYIRSPEQRELLHDLDLVKAALFEREGKSGLVDLLSKSVANLQRMWMDD